MRSLDLQKTVYDVLSADADLAALGAGVFDHVPQGNNFPRVVIGDDSSVQMDTDDRLNADYEIELHHYSRDAAPGSPLKTRHSGKKQVKLQEQACYKALHRATLTMVGAVVTDIQATSSESFLDEDGLTRHLVQRFMVLIDDITP
jgi:hypothetical protein